MATVVEPGTHLKWVLFSCPLLKGFAIYKIKDYFINFFCHLCGPQLYIFFLLSTVSMLKIGPLHQRSLRGFAVNSFRICTNQMLGFFFVANFV